MLNQPDARARCGEGAGSAMRSVAPAANVSLSPALGLRTETMTNDLARGRGPQYGQA